MIKGILLLSLLFVAYAGEDYYKLLGVTRNADAKTIKKAFKKLSLKYHPDKHTENKKEAEQMFMRIANAYETLTDPEKRKIYDQYGEEGLKGGQQQQQHQNMQFDDIFSSFFGGNRRGAGGAGGGFNFNFNMGGGKQQHHQHQHQEEKKAPFYDNTDVFDLDLGSLKSLYKRNEIWMVEFYSLKSKACEELKEEWIEMANKLYGIIKVAAVNCDEEEELCEEYNVKSYPTIIYYPDNTAKDHEVYTGLKTYKAMSDFAVSRMQSFVRIVNSKNIDGYFEEAPDQAKIILFTNKKSTPPLLKALSKEFKGKVILGEVRSTESELVSKYNIKEFPTIIGLNEQAEKERYTGEYKRDKLERWIREFMYNNIGQGSKVRELTRALNLSGKCSAGNSNLCFMMFTDKENDQVKDILKQLYEKFANDPIEFYWVDKKRYPGFVIEFEGEIVAFRPKRKKYSKIDCDFDLKCLSDKISNILSGGGDMRKLDVMPELLEPRREL